MNEKNSYDYIADAVRTYWENTFPQDVVAFFRQKYSYDDKWESLGEVVFCEGYDDYETISSLNDFCEGQTCVKDITIVPLLEVIEYYASEKLDYGADIKGGETGCG